MAASEPLYAHTPRRGTDRWHNLTHHAEAVARLGGEFASHFGATEIAEALGWSHDAAKADPRFQKYLRDSFEGKNAKKCPHAFAAAIADHPRLRNFALIVAGHHIGLPDSGEWRSDIEPNADEASVQAAKRFLQSSAPNAAPTLPTWLNPRDPLQIEMLIRMLFSTLIDADRLDTEAHYSENQTTERGKYDPLSTYQTKLTAYLDSFPAPDRPVNQTRHEILQACRSASAQPPGLFTLTVPTGGGKTLSGLAFALDHAIKHNKRRVIVAIPYTSIIDQTATVYEKVFGDGALLEHHSAVEMDDTEDPSEKEYKRRLATENWDCPLIVTTTVQLFHSLLSNKTSACRKLHNIADSVLIIDEVQALPASCLGPILDVLQQLIQNYGVTVVLSTATPPDYSPVNSDFFTSAREIVPDYQNHFQTLKRVRFEYPKEEWDLKTIHQELEQHPQSLVILNSRKDAVEIAKRADGLQGLTHLSTLLCGHHRKAILADIRQRLKDRLPVRLISTQVVEAGVDVDFPRVYRAVGPLDRIVQAAGRCNREGKLSEVGVCTVFRLKGGRAPTDGYKTATSITEPLLGKYGQSITEPVATRDFTHQFYQKIETGSLTASGNKADVQKLRRELKFKTVACTFKMIDQDTVPIIVESYQGADVASLIATWESNPVNWFRRVAPFTVIIYRNQQTTLQNQGLLRPHDSGAMIYCGPYDMVLGLGAETPDPADLVG